MSITAPCTDRDCVLLSRRASGLATNGGCSHLGLSLGETRRVLLHLAAARREEADVTAQLRRQLDRAVDVVAVLVQRAGGEVTIAATEILALPPGRDVVQTDDGALGTPAIILRVSPAPVPASSAPCKTTTSEIGSESESSASCARSSGASPTGGSAARCGGSGSESEEVSG